MTYTEYYKAVDALKAPADLNVFEQLDWLEEKIKELRTKLNKETLLRVLKDEKNWKDKQDSANS